jgi:hypothetical protein
MSWIKSQVVDNAGTVVDDNIFAKGNDWQLNIG